VAFDKCEGFLPVHHVFRYRSLLPNER
jgi:hypothetical protein